MGTKFLFQVQKFQSLKKIIQRFSRNPVTNGKHQKILLPSVTVTVAVISRSSAKAKPLVAIFNSIVHWNVICAKVELQLQ